ncbi:MAG: hypothetical protein O2955_17190 [Planctomycetota bacterium]|nr:hypothetical protein [Planctomycetota bacterium]MDA1214246.1 hypothetical protein [Planctomycetota bacterium]
MSSQSRKITYLIIIVCLLVGIVFLGMPASSEEGSGGRLAQLRVKHNLGEGSLGKVDPSSTTMNLLLLGLRGVATNLLWMEANEQQDHKNWAQLRTTVDSIILLQPHYTKVWRFQAWNLAYNVSASWDAVADRYFWVKEGIKFLINGSNRNLDNPELLWDTGNFMGSKIGRSDEWKQFRQYFYVDPEPRLNGGVDPELNPARKDNYLVAKDYFLLANDAEEKDPDKQHIMANILFRHYPVRAQFDYPMALQREGIFDQVTTEAWRVGYDEWTGKFGRELFDTETDGGWVVLEASDDDITRLAQQDGVSETLKREWVDRYQKMVNYIFWRTQARVEREELTMQAHRELYQGEQAFKESRMSEAQELLESGMAKFEKVMTQNDSLLLEDDAIEEALNAVLIWQHVHELEGKQVPANYPLKPLWDSQQERVQVLTNEFRREYGIK